MHVLSLHFIRDNDYYFQHRRESFRRAYLSARCWFAASICFPPKYFNVPRKEDSTFRSDDVYIRVLTTASNTWSTHFVAPNITRYSIACLRFYGVNRPLARPVTPRINSPWQSAGPPGNTRPRKSRNSLSPTWIPFHESKRGKKSKKSISLGPRGLFHNWLCDGEQLSQSIVRSKYIQYKF